MVSSRGLGGGYEYKAMALLGIYLLAHGGRFDRLWTGNGASDFDQFRKSSSD
jgi:hypothetical protein